MRGAGAPLEPPYSLAVRSKLSAHTRVEACLSAYLTAVRRLSDRPAHALGLTPSLHHTHSSALPCHPPGCREGGCTACLVAHSLLPLPWDPASSQPPPKHTPPPPSPVQACLVASLTALKVVVPRVRLPTARSHEALAAGTEQARDQRLCSSASFCAIVGVVGDLVSA